MDTVMLVLLIFSIFFAGLGTGLLAKRNIIKDSVGDIMIDELEGPIIIFDSQEALDSFKEKNYVVFRIRKKNKG